MYLAAIITKLGEYFTRLPSFGLGKGLKPERDAVNPQRRAHGYRLPFGWVFIRDKETNLVQVRIINDGFKRMTRLAGDIGLLEQFQPFRRSLVF